MRHTSRLLLTMLAAPVAVGVLLFGAAGRWDVPIWWAYLGVWAAYVGLTFARTPPELWEERRRPGPGGADNLALLRVLAFLVFGGHFVLAGLDVGRFHWSDAVPPALSWVGLAGFAGVLAFAHWAVVSNPFFSSAMRIQRDRGHRVVSSGPYALLRHPGYAAFILTLPFSALALGSFVAVLPALGCAALFVRRAAKEDRLLRAELPGYADYAARVRYRLVPGVW